MAAPQGSEGEDHLRLPRPEFTPPVIYSREARDRMVFLVEALPTNGQGLTPGQPIDVVPLKAAQK